jgi:neurotransmitter:Na+ symporter, NSS family
MQYSDERNHFFICLACALGFNVWDYLNPFSMSILDFIGFLTNSVMMPGAANNICIFMNNAVLHKAIAGQIRVSPRFMR